LLGDQAATNYPPEFTYLGQGEISGTLVPFSVVLFSLLAIIFGLILHRTTFGRYLYVIGNNQEAAVYSGVPVDRVKLILFTLSGFMSAMAGIILAARFGSTRPDIGSGLELTVITVAVLGGVDINGGKGSLPGAVLSLLLMGLMRFGMGLVNIQGQAQGVIIGLLLVLSILLPNLVKTFSTRTRRGGLNRRDLAWTAISVVLIVVFFAFFFYSRAAILAGS
jgi:rhamnose transport system permease protein